MLFICNPTRFSVSCERSCAPVYRSIDRESRKPIYSAGHTGGETSAAAGSAGIGIDHPYDGRKSRRYHRHAFLSPVLARKRRAGKQGTRARARARVFAPPIREIVGASSLLRPLFFFSFLFLATVPVYRACRRELLGESNDGKPSRGGVSRARCWLSV